MKAYQYQKRIREARKAIKEAREHTMGEFSICKTLRAKGETSGLFPVAEYVRGYINSADTLLALDKIEKCLLPVPPQKEEV